MKSFYDFRNANFNDPTALPLKGIVLLKRKTKWIIWVKSIGLIVCPRSIYLFDWYIPKNPIDALKHLFKK